MQAPHRSLRNPDGSVNKGAIYDLQNHELKAWVEQRLLGDDLYLPLGRSEELPHTLLLGLFEAADPAHPFRERLHQVTRELLEPVLTGRSTPFSPAWMGELLCLAFGIRAQVSRGNLRRAFEEGTFSGGPYLEAGTDVELLDLLTVQEGLEPVGFWNSLVQQPRYSLTALAALERYGPQAVVRGLPTVISTLRSTTELGSPESRLALTLKHVLERFGIDQLLPLLETQLAYPDQVVVQNSLGKVGIPVTFERAEPGLPRFALPQILHAIENGEDSRAFAESLIPTTPIRPSNGYQPNRMP